MKKLKTQYLICLFLMGGVIFAPQALAIHYFASKDGQIVEIEESQLNGCLRIIYRTKAKEDLPLNHKKKLLESLLRGEAVSTFEMALATLRANPGYCTYGSGEEVLKKRQ